MTHHAGPLDPPATAARRTRLRARLAADELDALLVTDITDIRYLTGFTGSAAALLLPADESAPTVMCTDGRYTEQAAAEAPALQVLIDRGGALALLATVTGGRIGFDPHAVTVAAHTSWQQAATAVDLIRVSAPVAPLRAVKDDTERQALTAAYALADRALGDLIDAGGIRPGRTEREVALDLDERMRRLGSQDISFPTILAAGEHSAIPHHRPTDRALRRGDLVKIDYGAVVSGYHSDTTRMVVLGAPATWQDELHQLVATAQQHAIDAIRPGAELAAVDAAARGIIGAAGHAEHFPHGLGHGVGLEVHEAPYLSATATGIMSVNMTVTVEPGIYLPGRGGIRIEDGAVVRPEGHVILSQSPRELLVID